MHLHARGRKHKRNKQGTPPVRLFSMVGSPLAQWRRTPTSTTTQSKSPFDQLSGYFPSPFSIPIVCGPTRRVKYAAEFSAQENVQSPAVSDIFQILAQRTSRYFTQSSVW